MTRKILMYTVPDSNRDHGKVFKLTEMPARQAHDWGTKALLALARSGIDVPANILDMGLAGIASLGVTAIGSMEFKEGRELLDQLMACVQCVPNPERPEIVRPLIEDDIDEWTTHYKLEREVFELHTGFFARAASLRSVVAAALSLAPSATSPGTPTSPVQ